MHTKQISGVISVKSYKKYNEVVELVKTKSTSEFFWACVHKQKLIDGVTYIIVADNVGYKMDWEYKDLEFLDINDYPERLL